MGQPHFLLACACAFLILKANDSCVLNFQTSGLVYVLTIDMCVYPQVTSLADAGIPTPDPEIEFRREVDLDDIGQGDQGHFDDHDGSDRETLEEGHGF
jgi:hypothetical protein